MKMLNQLLLALVTSLFAWSGTAQTSDNLSEHSVNQTTQEFKIEKDLNKSKLYLYLSARVTDDQGFLEVKNGKGEIIISEEVEILVGYPFKVIDLNTLKGTFTFTVRTVDAVFEKEMTL